MFDLNVKLSFFCFFLFADAMATPSPAKSMGDPGITPLSPTHVLVSSAFYCQHDVTHYMKEMSGVQMGP